MRRWLKRIALALVGLVVVGAGGLALAVYGWRYPAWKLAPDRGQPLLVTAADGTLLRSVPGAGGAKRSPCIVEGTEGMRLLTFFTGTDGGSRRWSMPRD